jgi:hypothetical protein
VYYAEERSYGNRGTRSFVGKNTRRQTLILPTSNIHFCWYLQKCFETMNIHPSLLVPFVYFCSCPGPPPKQRVHRVFVPKRGTNFAFMQYFYKLLSPLLWHHQLERVQRKVFNLMVHISCLFFYACILFLITSTLFIFCFSS